MWGPRNSLGLTNLLFPFLLFSPDNTIGTRRRKKSPLKIKEDKTFCSFLIAQYLGHRGLCYKNPGTYTLKLYRSVITAVICKFKMHFCLQPLAKDLGITRVVLVLVFHVLVSFPLKSKFKLKKSSFIGNQTRVLQHHSQVLYQLGFRNIVIHEMENDLFDFRISKTTPQTSRQSLL